MPGHGGALLSSGSSRLGLFRAGSAAERARSGDRLAASPATLLSHRLGPGLFAVSPVALSAADRRLAAASTLLASSASSGQAPRTGFARSGSTTASTNPRTR